MRNVLPFSLGLCTYIQVTANMAQVVRGMDRAMESMNLERVFPYTQHR